MLIRTLIIATLLWHTTEDDPAAFTQYLDRAVPEKVLFLYEDYYLN